MKGDVGRFRQKKKYDKGYDRVNWESKDCPGCDKLLCSCKIKRPQRGKKDVVTGK